MNKANPLKRVLIMAGGTGGHVFPGLALAAYLKEHGVSVDWLGTAQGIESKIVSEAGIPLYTISISGVRGKGLKTLLWAPFRLFKAVIEARRIILKLNPQLVIGFGGFASGPGGLATFLTSRPLVIQEQNANPGLTNKWLSRIAKVTLEAFPGTFPKSVCVRTVGNPVRQTIENLPPPSLQRSDRPSRVLILGGSLGAHALNECVPKALMRLPLNLRPMVWHQTGEKDFLNTKKNYEFNKIEVNLQPFIKDMAAAYDWADIVICRAGALTISELCAAGKPAILIPYPHAVDDHQTANALHLVNAGAATLIPQTELTETKLAAIVEGLLSSREERFRMAQAAFRLRQEKVAEKIANICEEILV